MRQPLAGFLDGIPPHRSESCRKGARSCRRVSEIARSACNCLAFAPSVLRDAQEGKTRGKDKCFSRLQRRQKEPAKAGSFATYGWVSRIPALPSVALDPLTQASAGRIPKNVPLARFLYGIPPHRSESSWPGQKENPERGFLFVLWLGQQDSNLHSWHQKPESCHWTMAQR